MASSRLADTLREHCLCPICMELFSNTVLTECNHRFCRGCIEEHLRKNESKCPTCREVLPATRRSLRDDKWCDALIQEGGLLLEGDQPSAESTVTATTPAVEASSSTTTTIPLFPSLVGSSRDIWYKEEVTSTFEKKGSTGVVENKKPYIPNFQVSVQLCAALEIPFGQPATAYIPCYKVYSHFQELQKLPCMRNCLRWFLVMEISGEKLNASDMFTFNVNGEEKLVIATFQLSSGSSLKRNFIICSGRSPWRLLDDTGKVLRDDVANALLTNPWFHFDHTILRSTMRCSAFKVLPELNIALGIPSGAYAFDILPFADYAMCLYEGENFFIGGLAGENEHIWRGLLGELCKTDKTSPKLELFFFTLNGDECRLVCRNPSQNTFLMFPKHGNWLEVKAGGTVLHEGWMIDLRDADDTRKKKKKQRIS